MRHGNLRQLALSLAVLFFVISSVVQAQMAETYKADQSSKTDESVMELFFCESDGGFSFSLYDKRVNPPQRLLHKYEVQGVKVETGKMKRTSEERAACAGAPDASLTSELVTVGPIPVPEEEDFLWILRLKMEGNLKIPIAVAKKGLPFKVALLYHPETKDYKVQQ